MRMERRHSHIATGWGRSATRVCAECVGGRGRCLGLLIELRCLCTVLLLPHCGQRAFPAWIDLPCSCPLSLLPWLLSLFLRPLLHDSWFSISLLFLLNTHPGIEKGWLNFHGQKRALFSRLAPCWYAVALPSCPNRLLFNRIPFLSLPLFSS